MTQVRRRAVSPPKPAQQIHIRRAYTDGRYGQLHLTTAYPSGGGFDERVPLVCLHPAAASGTWFRSLLPELGCDRSVYAPDLPGHGQSDPLAGIELGIQDHLAALDDFLDGMRLRSVDLFGHQLGATVAMQLAAQRPQQIRRVILSALPVLPKDDAARKKLPATLAARPATATRLADVTQPALLLSTADLPASQGVESPLPHHSVAKLPQTSDELFGAGAKEFARLLREFLDK